MEILIGGMILLAITSLSAVTALIYFPKLWMASSGVLVTAVPIVLYVPIRFAIHTPSSFDPVGDGFGILIEFFFIFSFFFGPLHIGSFYVLADSVYMELRQRWDMVHGSAKNESEITKSSTS